MFRPHVIERTQLAALRVAAADAWSIYQRVLPVLQALPDETLLAAGVPEAALAIVRVPPPNASHAFARFDFALVGGVFRVLELNADTPYFVWESFEISGALARHAGLDDPNAGCELQLGRSLAAALSHDPNARAAIATTNAYREDWFTALFTAASIERASGRRVDVVPLHDLHMNDGLLADRIGRIDALLRMYPLEAIAHDPDGPALFDAVASGALALLNPPWSLLLQTKMAQVVIWGLAESGAHFTPDECATVRRLFLPTYADLPGDGKFVEKPVLGREGDTIRIIDRGTIVEASGERRYAAQQAVYQQYVDLSRVGFHDTGSGENRTAKAIYTCFVVDGEPSAAGLRAGGEIITTESYFVPLAVG